MSEQSHELSQPEWRVLSSLFPALDVLPETSWQVWQRQRIKAGETLFNPGMPCHRFVLLGEGRVRVQVQSQQGRRMTLYRLQPGQLCMHSLFNLINEGEFAFEAVAERDGWLSYVSSQTFQKWLNDSPVFRSWIFASIGERYSELLERTASLAFSSVERRLADLVIERMGSDSTVTLTQSEMAVELGSAREVVLRHLKTWEQAGWVEKSRGQLKVLNVGALLDLLMGPSVLGERAKSA